MSLLAAILNHAIEQHNNLLAQIAVLQNHSLRVSDIPDIVLAEVCFSGLDLLPLPMCKL